MALDLARQLRSAPPAAAPQEIRPNAQIVHGPITFVAHCSRDGMPYFGQAFVGYVPTSTRIGSSMLQRMVHQAARRGEAELDGEIAAIIQLSVHPEGIALAVTSSHDCVGPRLIDDVGRSHTAWRGRYRADRSLRAEFLARCRAAR
jgi:GTP cyclohydrolase I